MATVTTRLDAISDPFSP